MIDSNKTLADAATMLGAKLAHAAWAAEQFGEIMAEHELKLRELPTWAKDTTTATETPVGIIRELTETSPGLEQVGEAVIQRATIDSTVSEFYTIVHRALNTLDPLKTPQWAVDLSDKLYQYPKDGRPVEILFRLTP